MKFNDDTFYDRRNAYYKKRKDYYKDNFERKCFLGICLMVLLAAVTGCVTGGYVFKGDHCFVGGLIVGFFSTLNSFGIIYGVREIWATIKSYIDTKGIFTWGGLLISFRQTYKF